MTTAPSWVSVSQRSNHTPPCQRGAKPEPRDRRLRFFNHTQERDVEAKHTPETFEQGWAARPFAEQFPELPADRAAWLDRLNVGITDMLLSGLMTDSAVDAARNKKFPKIVSRELAKARRAAKATQ